MFNIVNLFGNPSNQWLNVILLMIAMFRIYLEVVDFKFTELPITKGMFKTSSEAERFHRHGLYLCVGYVIFWAPFTLFS